MCTRCSRSARGRLGSAEGQDERPDSVLGPGESIEIRPCPLHLLSAEADTASQDALAVPRQASDDWGLDALVAYAERVADEIDRSR